MVAHGRERAEDFTVDRITERWAEVIFEKIPRIAATRSFELSRALPLPARRGLNVSLMPPAPHEMWKMGGYLYRTLRGTIS